MLSCNGSDIIHPDLAMVLANWIDRNDSNVHSLNNKYKFNLIYKKSQDGFNCTTFHNRCNGQGPFIVLIKLQSKKIYGDYNPIGYVRRQQWVSSYDSFIFSFENNQDMYNMKIDRVINADFSIYKDCNSSLFNFGNQLYVHVFGSNLYLCDIGNYSNILGNTNLYLPIEEIESFSVVKK